jgi:DNA-binding IclR family transcriptional regulator
MADKSSYKRIEATVKAGQILKHLGTCKEPQTAHAIADACGIPHGTTMCHLVSWEEVGFVRKVGDGWELAMGIALLWARFKSGLEGQRDRINSDLESIKISGGA